MRLHKAADEASATGTDGASPCRFGAPLVASALQSIGVLEAQVNPATITPAALPTLPLEGASLFGRPVPIRQL